MPERHPWNTDFTWRVSAPPYQVLTAEQVHQFDRDGYVVVLDAFDRNTITEITDIVDRFEAEVDAFLGSLEGHRLAIAEAGAITFAPHLVARSDVLRDFALHPFLAGVAADLLGPDVNLYWDQAVYKKPEKPRRFPWHQDNGYTFVEPQQYLTCWIALTDATIDNGCPKVARGLHRAGTLSHHYVEPLGWECTIDLSPDRVVTAEVPAGGVVIFSSLTPHLTGPNLTDAVRKAYIVQYAPEGAEILDGQPPAPPTGRRPANVPDRQFPVTRNGARVLSGRDR